MKFKNVSEKVKNFKVLGEWISVPVNEVIDLHHSIIDAEDGIIVVEEEESETEEIVEEYTKTDLIDMTKAEQVMILKFFGLKDKQISKLSNEKKRVD